MALAAFFTVALAVHAVRSVMVFRPVGRLLRDEPVLTDDNALHSYYTTMGAELIARSGQSDGYDPSDMAGHPKIAIHDPAITVVEHAMATLSFLPRFVVYQLFVLAALAAAAVCPLIGLHMLGLRGVAWALAWASVMFHFWWGSGLVFTFGGMNTWSLAANLGLLLVGATAQLSRAWAWPLAALVGALLVAEPYIHPVGIVLVAASALVLLIASVERKRALVFVGVCGALSLLANRGWMWDAYVHRQVATPLAEIMGGAQSPLVLADIAWQGIRAAPGKVQLLNRVGMAAFEASVAVLAVVALVWLRRRRDDRFVPLLVPLVIFGFLTYLSRPIGALQNLLPWRLRFEWLGVASATAGIMLGEWLRATDWRRLIAVASGFVGCAFFFAYDARPDVQHLQLGFDDVQRQWIDAINQTTDRRARILVEDGPGYRGMGVAGLHLGTNALWIGGPYKGAYIVQHRVNFMLGRLSGRPVATYSNDDLAQFFRRYNVRWVLAWSDGARGSFDARPTLVRRQRLIDGLAFYEVIAPVESFFERGAGTIDVALDTIRVRDVVPDNGSIVLRYHYYEHLVVQGAKGLRRFELPGDPAGFIEVMDPAREVTIHSAHTRAGGG